MKATVTHDEIECAAVIAALNLVEYPYVADVFECLNCWSFCENIYMPLMDILKTLSSRPVSLKKPKRVYHNGREQYELCDVSQAGWKAYNRLIVLIYGLEKQGIVTDSSHIVKTLDDIIDEQYVVCDSQR